MSRKSEVLIEVFAAELIACLGEERKGIVQGTEDEIGQICLACWGEGYI